MKIRIIPVENPALSALFQHFNAVANERGIDQEDALREALRLWLDRAGEQNQGECIMEATTAEHRVLVAVLAAIRGAQH